MSNISTGGSTAPPPPRSAVIQMSFAFIYVTHPTLLTLPISMGMEEKKSGVRVECEWSKKGVTVELRVKEEWNHSERSVE